MADDVLVAACDKLDLSGGAAFELTLADIGGDGPECGAVPWDPMGFAEYGKFGSLPAKLAWYRHAEIKHGRVAMAAFVGWLATANGYFFDGFLSRELGIKFADLGTDPLSAWEQMPASGKVQMLLAVGALEVAQETVEPHYLRGGEPGRFPLVRDSVLAPFRQFGIYNGAIKKQCARHPPAARALRSRGENLCIRPHQHRCRRRAAPPPRRRLEAQGRTVESLRQEKLLSELKNGRLAMIGMASLYAASVVPDSVPFFKGGIAPFPVG